MLRYAITDRRQLAHSPGDSISGASSMRDRQSAHEWEDALIAQAAALAARGDIDFLQLREKDLPTGKLVTLARRILEALCSSAQRALFLPRTLGDEREKPRPKLLINSRADVAVAVRADGVHLTSSRGELTPAQVRALYSEAGLHPPAVSLSCHTVAEVIAARGLTGYGSGDALCFAPDPATAPDLILFGPVFEKVIANPSDLHSTIRVAEGSGLELLRRACDAATPIPVLALGGITKENAAECLSSGAAGIAAIRLFNGYHPATRRQPAEECSQKNL